MPEPFNMAWLIQGGERPQASPQVTVCGFVDTPESPAEPLQVTLRPPYMSTLVLSL